MHRKHTPLGCEVVRDRENSLFHVSGIFRSEDDEFFVFEAQVDTCRRAHAGREAISRKRACVVDHEIGSAKARKLLARRANEHRVHKKGVIWPRANDADIDAILWVPSCETVEAVKSLACVEVVERTLPVDLEGVLVEGDINRPPPNIVLRGGILDYALVLR
jgi:hypothetical protein